MSSAPHGLLDDRWVRLGARAWALTGVALLVAGALWLLGRTAPVLTPFLLALVVVIVLRRPVALLEARGVARWLAVVVCYVVSAVIVTVASLFVVPVVAREVAAFAEEFPRYYDAVVGLWARLESEYAAVEWPAWVGEVLLSSRATIVSWATQLSGSTARLVVTLGGRFFGFFVHLFLALALAFFVLRDLPTIKTELFALAGPGRRAERVRLASEVVSVLEGFLRGQLIIATVVGVITGVGLAVLGVPYAAVIGLIAGVTNLVPYVGPFVGGAVAAVSAAFVSPQLMFWTIAWVFVVQQTESLALQPRVMSHQVRIHPALVIVSLTIGAAFFGLAGMLLAVPVAAVLTVVFVHYYEKSSGRDVRTDGGVLFPARRAKAHPDEMAAETPASADGGA
ncbi:MAG: AI-2E family transporter [Coriobacteriia bacterium]|nr:AI-2E family transporter [Coriobacteriia bacterium]